MKHYTTKTVLMQMLDNCFNLFLAAQFTRWYSILQYCFNALFIHVHASMYAYTVGLVRNDYIF